MPLARAILRLLSRSTHRAAARESCEVRVRVLASGPDVDESSFPVTGSSQAQAAAAFVELFERDHLVWIDEIGRELRRSKPAKLISSRRPSRAPTSP
jgi:hypothetical protein